MATGSTRWQRNTVSLVITLKSFEKPKFILDFFFCFSFSPVPLAYYDVIGKDGCVTMWLGNRLGVYWISPEVTREIFHLKGATDGEIAKVRVRL